MSENVIDEWLKSLKFENYRLEYTPKYTRAKVLEATIRNIESQPIDGAFAKDFGGTLLQLEILKKDLASMHEMNDLVERLHILRDRLREQDFLSFHPESAAQVMEGLQAWFEKKKIEQRKRQRLNVASLGRLWPNADQARKRQMVKLFVTYGRRRFAWGTLNILLSSMLRLGLWTNRRMKR